MALARHTSATATTTTRDFKQRVLICLNKLSDRDTHSAAATELESIAKSLNHDCISPFLSSISATDSSDKSPVRKQCVRLISLLSETHGDALSSHLSKLLSAVVRRLRDPDTAVRSACVAATASISSHITKPPFTSIAKPLVDALVTEQDQNSQIGAALCLASAIDASPDPEPMYLRRLLPRIEKLLKCESFKAKPALLSVVGSVIGVGAASSQVVVRNLVKFLVEFVSSEDWATRKSAAEALGKLAVVEIDLLSEFKAPCLKTFEAKRFDKVKVVRETMNQMVESWKAIPDEPEEVSPPPESQSSSKATEVTSDGRYPPGGPQSVKKQILDKSSVSYVNNGKTGPAMFRKLDRKKPGSGITAAETLVSKDDMHNNRLKKPETKRVLFNNKSDDKIHESGGSNPATPISQYHDVKPEPMPAANSILESLQKGQKECEDLALIRKQLVQIESQQSSLMDLLQKFIGSSQNGMRSLELRVHGLELALDEISFDLARSNRRMSNNDSTESVCCKLPGADFLSSKLWRKSDGQYANSRFSSSIGTNAMAGKNANNEAFKPENRRFRLQGGASGGLIVNPLAEVHSDSHGISEISSNGANSQRPSLIA